MGSKHGLRAFLKSAAFANDGFAACGSLASLAPLFIPAHFRHQDRAPFVSQTSSHPTLALSSNVSFRSDATAAVKSFASSRASLAACLRPPDQEKFLIQIGNLL
jgi:hypothetical protein